MAKARLSIGFPVTFPTSTSSGSVTIGNLNGSSPNFSWTSVQYGYQAVDTIYTQAINAGYGAYYAITKSGTAIIFEALNDGAQWNFGTSSYSSGDGAELTLAKIDYSAPCDLAWGNPKTTIVNDTGGQGKGKITIHATSSRFISYAIQIAGGTKTAYQSSNVFENLVSGNYTVFILDSGGCSNFVNFQEVKNTACVLEADVKEITHETGEGLNNGSFKAVPKNAAYGTINYSLDGGAPQTTVLFTGVAPGLHTIYITDSTGCTAWKNFTINEYVEPPSDPGECFDPEMSISDAIPYRFVVQKCNAADETETLYNETPYCQGEDSCYFQLLNCDDTLTLQIYYLDEENNSIPVLKIRDWSSQAVLSTLAFTDLGSGYYNVEKNINEISGLCEKRVYLEIKSKSIITGNELFTHAASEPIFISNYHDCNLLLEYWNNSNYRGILYEDTGYVNKMRLEATVEPHDYPQEIEKYIKSNGVSVKLREEIREENALEVNYAPMYVHKKIALALSHDNVRIGNQYYVKEEPYTFEAIRGFALRKGTGTLMTREYQSKNLIK